MNERTEFDRVLGGWLKAGAPRVQPEQLLVRVFEKTSRTRPMPSWRALLATPPMRTHSTVLVGSPTIRMARAVVIVVLGALLLAGALVAAGSRLVLPMPAPIVPVPPLPAPIIPVPPDQPATISLIGAGCASELPEGQLMTLVLPGRTMMLFEDGQLVTWPSEGRAQWAPFGTTGITARTLSPAGVRLLTEAIEHDPFFVTGQSAPKGRDSVGPAGPFGCRRAGPGDYGRLSIRWTDTEVARTEWGDGVGPAIRALSSAEGAALVLFDDRMQQLEGWLPAEAWIDSTERPYVPDRWLVSIRFGVPGPGPLRVGPPLDAVRLPDGEAVVDLGSAFRLPPEEGEASRGAGTARDRTGRCAIVGPARAREIVETLDGTGAGRYVRPGFESFWQFTEQPNLPAEGPVTEVKIDGLLPGEVDPCPAAAQGLDPHAAHWEYVQSAWGQEFTPNPGSDVTPVGTLGELRPCELMPLSRVRDAWRQQREHEGVLTQGTEADESSYLDGSPAWQRVPIWWEAGIPVDGLGADYRECLFGFGDIRLGVHIDATSEAVARSRARLLLGPDAVETSVAGLPVWRTGCIAADQTIRSQGCGYAAAISAEPYFAVLVSWGFREGHDRDSAYLAMLEAVVDAMAQAASR